MSDNEKELLLKKVICCFQRADNLEEDCLVFERPWSYTAVKLIRFKLFRVQTHPYGHLKNTQKPSMLFDQLCWFLNVDLHLLSSRARLPSGPVRISYKLDGLFCWMLFHYKKNIEFVPAILLFRNSSLWRNRQKNNKEAWSQVKSVWLPGTSLKGNESQKQQLHQSVCFLAICFLFSLFSFPASSYVRELICCR